MNIDFTPEQLVAFYRSTSTDGRKAVKEALGEQFSEALPATERVKTYEDAVWELGNDHPLVEAASSAEWRFTTSSSSSSPPSMTDGSPSSFPASFAGIPGMNSSPRMNTMPCPRMRSRSAVVLVARMTMRMRMAVSFSRMRLTPRRTRTRTSALGSPSNRKRWQNMPESSSQNCLRISASSPSLMKKSNRA